MKARGPLFPSLGAETALADVQMRQTLALGLVPLGLVLLLFAAAAPDAPPWSVWVAGGLALGGLAVLAGMWRRAGRRKCVIMRTSNCFRSIFAPERA